MKTILKMNKIDILKYCSKRKDDEFYTQYKNVKKIFEHYLKNYDFTDKIIYCPCDSVKSNFVVYLKENKDVLKYKELIYTWDDFNTHKDLFLKADIIITNPPFSLLLKQFLPLMNEINKDFFIIGSKNSFASYFEKNHNFKIYGCKPEEMLFIRPDCTLKLAGGVYITNIDGIVGRVEPKTLNTNAKISLVTDENGYRVYDKITDIYPYEDDWFRAPTTVIVEHWRYMFDIKDKINHNSIYSDGKSRFIRVLCKIKPEFRLK